jgi:hypothetical protein
MEPEEIGCCVVMVNKQHVTRATDMHATTEEIVRNGVFY